MKKLVFFLILGASTLAFAACSSDSPKKPEATIIVEEVGQKILVLRPVAMAQNSVDLPIIFLGKRDAYFPKEEFFWFKQKPGGNLEIICETNNSNKLPTDLAYIIVDTLNELSAIASGLDPEKKANLYLNPDKEQSFSVHAESKYQPKNLFLKQTVTKKEISAHYNSELKTIEAKNNAVTKDFFNPAILIALILFLLYVTPRRKKTALRKESFEKISLTISTIIFLLSAQHLLVIFDRYALSTLDTTVMAIIIGLIFTGVGFMVFSLAILIFKMLLTDRLPMPKGQEGGGDVYFAYVITAGLVLATIASHLELFWIPTLIIMTPNLFAWTTMIFKGARKKVETKKEK